MKISIFGIGYVGAVTAACLAESGHDVVAVDTDPVKVACLLEGRTPIIEEGLEERIAKAAADKKLSATASVQEAVDRTEMSLICVGTPSAEDGSLSLKYVEDVCRQIGAALKNKSTFHTVVLRSTVVPGSARNVAIPALEAASGKKAGVGFGFGNNPEFLRESSAIYDYYNPPKIVIGASDPKTAEAIKSIYKGIEAPTVVTTVDVSEGVKYADNAWHAMKVGFANELGNILKDHGVDSHKVMDIFFLDTKLNISKAYLKPGFAFGGSCLPKDVKALKASAKAKKLNTPIFDALMIANDEQVQRGLRLIEQTGQKKVGLFGLSFKAGTDDLRESPLVTLADMLLKKGYSLSIYDPDVWRAKHMDGANRAYIEKGIPHISACLREKPEQALAECGVVVVGNKGPDFPAILRKAPAGMPIIDLVRLNDAEIEQRPQYTGICW